MTYHVIHQWRFEADTVAGGDSGSPVFIRVTGPDAGNKVKIAGLMWGGFEASGETYFSPWGTM